jgi:hypothetical protein
VGPPVISHLFPFPRPSWRRTRARGMGQSRRLAGPHAERPVLTLGLVPPGAGLLPPFAPVPRSSEARPAWRRWVPPRPLRRSNRGSQGNSHHPSRRCASNAGEGSKPQSPKPPTPLGFSSPFFLCARCERRRREGKRGGEGIIVGACFAYAGTPQSCTPEPKPEPLRQAASPSPSGLLRLHR